MGGENSLAYFGKSAKNFFYRKKIRLQVSKSGVFAPKKVSLIFFFFFRNKLQVKNIWRILENLQKTFFIGQKSNFKFQNRGYFGKKESNSPLVAGTFFREKNNLRFC